MDLSFLPHVNAALNSAAFVLLVTGFVFIKNGRVAPHRACMIGAATFSGLFLICYVVHYVWRASVMGGSHTPFNGVGVIKKFYYALLLSHIALAIFVPYLAGRLIWLGAKGRYPAHKRLAKIGFPVWLYVSLTGVFVYVMLYWLNPQP